MAAGAELVLVEIDLRENTMNIQIQTHYDLLHLSVNASQEEIENACFHYGEQFRPDKNPGNPEAARMFAVFEDAFATLIDPAKRAAYDKSIGILSIYSDGNTPTSESDQPFWNWKRISIFAPFALLAFFYAYGVLTQLTMDSDRPTPASKIAAANAKIAPESAGNERKPAPITYSPDSNTSNSDPNSCFLRGKATATVYLANISQMADAGLMPSRVMTEGCAGMVGSSCVHDCELGFRSVARAAMR